ncbi:hypothetical protein MMC07_003183 [Pseudocyphellaria aurata]|nr:hypothetical protein [Pseudocyphellaria aurata]
MADEPVADEAPITFNIKSSSDAKYVLTMPLSVTVLDLKSKLADSEYAGIPPERQRLIYSGRVLKDPDTLASYKIKEGNTIHLVKGAASNQRQNPASSSTAAASSGSAPATGVPTNIAAGTGNNPLAGLTGARYAGFAQLPGAGIFGPDGGMGPPPDPEQMISLLENPQFASTMNEALQNPQIIDQMIQGNPLLRGMGPQVRQAMQDPNFRRIMTDPAMMRQMTQMSRQMGMGGGFGGMGGGAGGEGAFPAPGITDTTPGQDGERANTTANAQNSTLPPMNPFAMFGGMGGNGTNASADGAAGAANPFAALFGNPLNSGTPGTAGTSQGQGSSAAGTEPGANNSTTPQPPVNPFNNLAQNPLFQNPALMQQMFGAMAGGEGGSPGVPVQPNPFNPFATFGAQPQTETPRDTRPPEERYEEQLRQLNDMGFYEFERNVEALRRTGGSVQGAVEYLLNH